MPAPTIESRRRKRAVIMTANAAACHALASALPEDWEWLEFIDFGELGGFEDVLQLRFILVDLERSAAWDAIDAITHVRSELTLNVPIFCFGGDAENRDRARMAGADRFFAPEALVEELPEFCRQFGW
jgi:hypothetical protein